MEGWLRLRGVGVLGLEREGIFGEGDRGGGGSRWGGWWVDIVRYCRGLDKEFMVRGSISVFGGLVVQDFVASGLPRWQDTVSTRQSAITCCNPQNCIAISPN